MMLEQFVDKNLNQSVSFDGVPQNEGQSPQLIALWCRTIGLPFQWADAADWWDDADETFAEHWHKINRPQSGDILPSPGDIVVFSNSLPGSHGYGHLSLFLEAVPDSSEWIGFDCNWGGMSAHRQSHNWAYVLGWFTPVNKSVLESPIPTPIASAIVNPEAFDLEPIEPATVQVTAESAPLYNLNDMAWDSFNANPISGAANGVEVTVVGIAKHRLGGTFLVPDADQAQGYSVDDCSALEQDHDIEVPEEEIESGPNRLVSMQAPLRAPAASDTVMVEEPIPCYEKNSDAFKGEGSIGQLDPGKYFVYKRLPNGMMNVTGLLGTLGFWINPVDLEPKPVEDTDWHKLDALDKPRYYEANQDSPILDQDGWQKPLSIKEGQPILIAGFFRAPDGKIYAAPQATYNGPDRRWYGIDRDYLKVYIPADIPEPPVVITISPRRDKMSLLLDRLKAKI